MRHRSEVAGDTFSDSCSKMFESRSGSGSEPSPDSCCNLSGGVALIVWFTTNRMCPKNKNICMWREQAIIEWSRRVISIVACCHGAKLCAHAARDFRSQQNGGVTRMWRSCGVQPSHKERAIGVVGCEKEGMLLQPLRWCCVDCVIHHERDVREE